MGFNSLRATWVLQTLLASHSVGSWLLRAHIGLCIGNLGRVILQLKMETAHDYSDGSEFTDERLFGTINDEKDFRNWDDDSDIDGSEGGDTSDQDTRKADVIILDWVDQPSEDTISLTESVTDYPVEHGRRYHRYRAGEYLLPNDEIEQRRLDHVHRIFRLALRGRLHLAPLQDPQRIIDLGTGTGNWAIDWYVSPSHLRCWTIITRT